MCTGVQPWVFGGVIAILAFWVGGFVHPHEWRSWFLNVEPPPRPVRHPALPVLDAFRVRFAHQADFETYTPFGFFEAGWRTRDAEVQRLKTILRKYGIRDAS